MANASVKLIGFVLASETFFHILHSRRMITPESRVGKRRSRVERR